MKVRIYLQNKKRFIYFFQKKSFFQGGTFKRCECESGLKPSLPDPATGIIKRCIGPNEAGVLSLISQALFGDDSSGNPVPLKINLKLTEKALLDTCQSTVSLRCFVLTRKIARI